MKCNWATKTQIEEHYHDNEWGKPSYNDNHIFEQLILEGAQAGLSWLTILNKRENYRAAYNNWNIQEISKFDEKKVEELLNNPGIVRNKLKVNSSINNAKLFIEIQKEFGSFSNYIWSYVNNKQIRNFFDDFNQIPASNELSDKISRDLKKRGFKFVGTTIIYAFLQAIGLIDDHINYCEIKAK